jgi:hypothetical protein
MARVVDLERRLGVAAEAGEGPVDRGAPDGSTNRSEEEFVGHRPQRKPPPAGQPAVPAADEGGGMRRRVMGPHPVRQAGREEGERDVEVSGAHSVDDGDRGAVPGVGHVDTRMHWQKLASNAAWSRSPGTGPPPIRSVPRSTDWTSCTVSRRAGGSEGAQGLGKQPPAPLGQVDAPRRVVRANSGEPSSRSRALMDVERPDCWS